MIPFFADPAHQAQLRVEAASWVDTPFRAHAAVKGAAVDCVCLTAEIMVACGLIASYHFPPYTMQWAKHQRRSIVLEWLDACPQVTRMPKETPKQIGDVLCYQLGRCVHHVGIMLDAPDYLSALEGARVAITRVDDSTWADRFVCLYRPQVL